jgi:phosphate transport system substrate-binding protein
MLACLGLVAPMLGAQLLDVAPAAAGVTATGTGSSYAAVAINNWVGQTANLYGLSLNYQTQSSVLGLDAYGAGQVDFAASEIGYNADQAQPVPPAGSYQYLPDVAGAMCIMYNIQSTTQQRVTSLQLNPQAILGIFDGTITAWSQLSSIGQNASLALPNSPIIPVVRTDASGDNYIMTDYFSTLLPGPWGTFQHALTGSAPGPSAIFPSAGQTGVVGSYDLTHTQSENGSDIASNTVAGITGAVAYVETAYAILHGIPCAAVQNGTGAFVQPSSLADAIALTKDELNADLTQNLTGVFTDSSPEDAGAYPISAYSYLVTPIGAGMSVAKAAVMAKFILFMACQGQVSAGQLGYSPIPPNLILDDFAAIGRLNGQTAPPPPNAQSCPNPYLTGAAQYVGGPIQLSTGGTGAASAAATETTTPIAGVNQVSAAQASSEVTTKTHGGLQAGQGQVLGVALNRSVGKLLGLSGPSLAILATSLVFLAIVLLPPTVGLLRGRRAKTLNTDDHEEDPS